MGDDVAALLLTLAAENTELRAQLAESQDQCVEIAVDAGELHAQIQAMKTDLAQARADRDAWRAEAEGLQQRRRFSLAR